MSEMTTVKSGFPVHDITHKPKRSQGANLRAAQMSETTTRMGEDATEEVPVVVTPERAIAFYESHAIGEYALLYSQTAKWLREYLSRSVPVNVEVAE